MNLSCWVLGLGTGDPALPSTESEAESTKLPLMIS